MTTYDTPAIVAQDFALADNGLTAELLHGFKWNRHDNKFDITFRGEIVAQAYTIGQAAQTLDALKNGEVA